MYKGLWINILAALLGLCVTFLIGNSLLPLLKKLRFITDGEKRDSSGEKLPISGGIMLCAGILISSAAGYLTMRFFSDSLDRGSENAFPYFIGQLIMLTAAIAGFYSDHLQSRGKKGGISDGYVILCDMILSAVFLVILFIKGNMDTALDIPFAGEIDLGAAYYPIMLAVMTIICGCFSETDKQAGAAVSAYAVFSIGAMAVFSGLSVNEYGILAAASAGSAMGFLVWNYPSVKILGGRCGSMLMGLGAAVMTVLSGKAVYMLIMLLPVLFDGICGLIGLRRVKETSYGAKNTVAIIFKYFIFSLVCVIAALALLQAKI
ncbi:MAG: hypothetical protein PUK49_08505 [Oscillospiraceae bacterium]|nr:hypothetical protein [Oscillospiraceae bacterium]